MSSINIKNLFHDSREVGKTIKRYVIKILIIKRDQFQKVLRMGIRIKYKISQS